VFAVYLTPKALLKLKIRAKKHVNINNPEIERNILPDVMNKSYIDKPTNVNDSFIKTI
jgi:hypothetical protein